MRELVRIKRENSKAAAELATRLKVSRSEEGVRVSAEGSNVIISSEQGLVLALANGIYFSCKMCDRVFKKLFSGQTRRAETSADHQQKVASMDDARTISSESETGQVRKVA